MDEAAVSKARTLRILVVENHRDTLMYLQMYLETLGYTVTPTRNVAEAHAALDKDEYDVLISDIGLPDGNGWDLLRDVHAHGHRHLFALAMSGFGLNSDQVRSKEAGYRHHLLKPFKPSELDEMLEQAARELPVTS